MLAADKSNASPCPSWFWGTGLPSRFGLEVEGPLEGRGCLKLDGVADGEAKAPGVADLMYAAYDIDWLPDGLE
jgi:hypothetical protein